MRATFLRYRLPQWNLEKRFLVQIIANAMEIIYARCISSRPRLLKKQKDEDGNLRRGIYMCFTPLVHHDGDFSPVSTV